MEIKFLGNYRNQNQGFCGSVYSRGGAVLDSEQGITKNQY